METSRLYRSRLGASIARYGWRAGPVGLLWAVGKIAAVRFAARRFYLQVTTLGSKGRELAVGANVRVTPGSVLVIEERVTIGDSSIVEISNNPRASVTIGANTYISHHCHICSFGSVEIGRSVLVGEYVSIRDSSHRTDRADVPIAKQGDRVGTIRIEEDVWIGRGVAILGRPNGVTIGRGSIIGANAVVTQSIPSGEVWAGVPAQFIRRRVYIE